MYKLFNISGIIQYIYFMCAYDNSWTTDKISPWCAVFTKEHLKVSFYYFFVNYYNHLSDWFFFVNLFTLQWFSFITQVMRYPHYISNHSINEVLYTSVLCATHRMSSNYGKENNFFKNWLNFYVFPSWLLTITKWI